MEAKNKVNLAKIALEKFKEKKVNIVKIDKQKANDWMNFKSVSLSEMLDEMNVQKEDTLRTLLRQLPQQKQRQRLIDVQK